MPRCAARCQPAAALQREPHAAGDRVSIVMSGQFQRDKTC